MSGRGRLVVVARADPAGRYAWLPSPRAGDITVVLDSLAVSDLAERKPIHFDELESWEERNAAEHDIPELLAAVGAHPAVAAVQRGGFPLYEFAEYRLRPELARLLRGFTLARAGAGVGVGAGVGARAGVGGGAGAGAGELVCDPALPQALQIGVRAGLGLDWREVPYALAPALPGSPARRAVARQLMRVTATASRPRRGRVRVAAVAAGKLALALASLSDAEMEASGLGLMPFPGLDHGNGLLLSLRRRRPLLGSYGPARPAPRATDIALPVRLGVEPEAALDEALTRLVGLVMNGAAPELEQAVAALGGLSRARSLRSIVLPSAAYGASRLVIEWAHERGLRVGSMQHGIYVFRDYDGGDRRADVLFGWGEGTIEQTRAWVQPRPRVLPVGVPGTPSAAPQGAAPSVVGASLRRVLVATSSTLETPIAPLAFCETFVQILAPGLRRLVAAGVEVRLRPHPSEEPARYRRQLDALGLGLDAFGIGLEVSADGPFQAAMEQADLLISSGSSVAFEAAAQGLPVLLWWGGTPEWVRKEHLMEPWNGSPPGTFEHGAEFETLVVALLGHYAQGLTVAQDLSRRLARYAEPFNRDAFAAGLRELAE
ncbi:MAG TPA: hypothetical protein VIC06_00275 [Solirubrobacteraceae bacterium]